MALLCEICGVIFSTDLDLAAHRTSEHCFTVGCGESFCCGDQYSTKYTLNRHLRTSCRNASNPQTSHSVENLLDREEHSCHVHDICSENAVSFTDFEENSLHITCYICDKPFTTRKNMYRHIRNVHDVEPSLTGPNSMHCPLCDAEFRTYKDVDGHLLSRHGIEQELEELSFDSLQDFNTWKSNEEAAVLAHYITRNVSRSRKYFICHRSGTSDQKSESSRIRWTQSLKTGKTCPARMILIETEEAFKVQYFKTHVGHELSVKFLRLTENERCLLASRLQEGVPMKRILHDENRKSAIENIITGNFTASNTRSKDFEKLKSILDTFLGLAINLPPQSVSQFVTQAEQLLKSAQQVLSSNKNSEPQLGESLKNVQSNTNISVQRFIPTKHSVRRTNKSIRKPSDREKKEIETMFSNINRTYSNELVDDEIVASCSTNEIEIAKHCGLNIYKLSEEEIVTTNDIEMNEGCYQSTYVQNEEEVVTSATTYDIDTITDCDHIMYMQSQEEIGTSDTE